MERASNIQEELMTISQTVANIPFVPTYTLSSQYFQSLPLMIIGRLVNPEYSTPDGYFDNLARTILQKIKNEETDELPAIFSQINKKELYSVPEGYFNKPISLNEKTSEAAPVININNSKRKTQWWKYAAAACMVGLFAVTMIKLIQPSNNVDKEDMKIAGTNVTYKEIKAINVEKALDSLSSAEVDDYLCNNGLIACNDDKKVEEKLDIELEELNISDEDLEKFIEGSN